MLTEKQTSHSPDFQDSAFFGKRSTDGGPSNADIMAVLTEIRAGLAGIESAFPMKNGARDYHGHCADHEYRIEQAKNFAAYKVEATKKVIGWAVGLMLLALGTGAIDHLKRLLGE